MKLIVLLAVSVLLCSCAVKTDAPTIQYSETTQQKFESAIAREILTQIRLDMTLLKGTARSTYLKQKQFQFNKAVNRNLLSRSMQLQAVLLDYLVASEDVRWLSEDYAARVSSLSSLSWSLEDYENGLMKELDRLNQTIAVLVHHDPHNRFSIERHMSAVRAGAEYPDDSILGRQTYLDQLADAMITMQRDWHDIYESEEASALDISGSETAGYSFRHDGKTLHINLSDVRDLPQFEIKSVAAFYGFPGLQAFIQKRETLSDVLHLPGYTLGWAIYMLDYVAIRDIAKTPEHLYFQKLIVGLALADLRVGQRDWSIAEATEYLYKETPYQKHRIRLMLSALAFNPGYYLAGFGGKVRFAEINQQCLETGKACQSAIHQQIVDHGPIPFDLLEARLFSLKLLSDQ